MRYATLRHYSTKIITKKTLLYIVKIIILSVVAIILSVTGERTTNEIRNKVKLSDYKKVNDMKMLTEIYKKYNNTELALAAYNAGSGNVDKWIQQGIIESSGENVENIPYKETNMYVRKVIQSEKIYESLYK